MLDNVIIRLGIFSRKAFRRPVKHHHAGSQQALEVVQLSKR